MLTIKQLRKLAELNLCEKCFQTYKEIIEPSVEEWLFEPLIDWRRAESEITQLAMKTKGIFKGKTIILSLDEGEEWNSNLNVDVKTFRKIKNSPFKQKIDFLHDKGILQNASYELLNKARKIREKIHGIPFMDKFSAKDYHLFSIASTVTTYLWQGIMLEPPSSISANFRTYAEKLAELALTEMDKQSPTV